MTPTASIWWRSQDGELLGTCRLVRVGRTVQFSRLAVRSDARRQGIATALLGSPTRRPDRWAPRGSSCTPRPTRRSSTSAPVPPPRAVFVEADIEHVAMEKPVGSTVASGGHVPELRIDPLSGQRAIVAGARAGRPGGELHALPPPPLDRENDPFAEGHEDRTPPELTRCDPDGGAPDAPGLDRCASCRTSTRRSSRRALPQEPSRSRRNASRDLFWSAPALAPTR